MKKILVIRLSSLGDIILSFPLLKKLKEKFPDAQVHFLTKKDYEEILKMNPDVDRIMLFNNSIKDLKNIIQNEKYDLVIDIHKNLRSIYLSRNNGKEILTYKKENLKKYFLVKFKINLFNQIIPVYQKYLLTIKKYSNEDDLKFSESKLLFSKDNITDGKYIVVSPTSRHFTKTYPADGFIDYIIKLGNKKVILVGDNSKKDLETCAYIESKCINVMNLCGKLNMKSLANILYNSEYVICNDSAILHFSEAIGKRVVAIFGSTVKEFGFYPQLKDSIVIENKNLKCRPCTHIGRESCPEKHFKCMLDLKLNANNI
ncbi:MAG: glycosyltransferase family 9 protein [Ignavibacteria bacterium]